MEQNGTFENKINDIPVEKLNLLQAWSKYHEKIAEYRNFKNKDETIANYTGTLKIIEEALKEKSIYQLDPFAIMDMVMFVPGRINSNRKTSFLAQQLAEQANCVLFLYGRFAHL